MIIEEVIQVGNPIIKRNSTQVKNVTSSRTQKIVQDLIDSMRHHELIGIAAPQIGKNLRIFVTEIRKTATRDPKHIDQLRIFINPEIIWKSKREVVKHEGCGSVTFAKLFGPVKRPSKVKVSAFDKDGKKFTLKAEGLLGRCIQHEYDHLDGIVCVQKMDMNKIMSSNEYIKQVAKKNN